MEFDEGRSPASTSHSGHAAGSPLGFRTPNIRGRQAPHRASGFHRSRISDGAGNLPVLRIASRLHVAALGGHLSFEETNYPTRAGWREIVSEPRPGAAVAHASKGPLDLSHGLTAYPQALTLAPTQDRSAWLEWPLPKSRPHSKPPRRPKPLSPR